MLGLLGLALALLHRRRRRGQLLAELAVAIRVGAGAAQDPAGREGLAHLLEHLTFCARPGAGQQTRWEQADLEGIAAENAHTRAESTTWVGIVPIALAP